MHTGCLALKSIYYFARMQFSEIVGQKHVIRQLIQTVTDNRVSHAQLFLGPAGSGSLPLAFAYAQYISCLNRQSGDSCGECASCRKYSRLIHPDLHFSYPFFAKHKEDTAATFIKEWRDAFLNNPYLDLDEWRSRLDAENKQANINIAECHQIIQKLSLKPFEGEYKILIMWLPEYLDKEGNTLLKLIEEPPHKTLFLLVAQNQDQVLNTIVSRTQLVKISQLKAEDISTYMQQQKGVDANRAAQLAYLSNGNLQSALEFLNQGPNNNFELFAQWLRHCIADRGLKITEFIETIARAGRENQKSFICYSINMLRECVVILSGAPQLVHLPPAELNFLTRVSQAISLAKAGAMIAGLETAHYHIERNANPRILFLDVSLQLVNILKFDMLPKGTHYIYN